MLRLYRHSISESPKILKVSPVFSEELVARHVISRLEQLRFRHLKFLRLLATLGWLAATAEHLSMTPSAASMMLKEIESIFGAKLFCRQGRGMALTDQGRALLPRCQTVPGELRPRGPCPANRHVQPYWASS